MNSLLSWILRVSHCHSTHHLFAVDALPMVQTDAGKRLVRLLLRHHDRYLKGTTDPDTRFCDFQNHVVHVTDGYWGGAPRVAHQWYDRMQRYLRTDRFSDAAHAAGVLSHYFTDPMQPLHTQHDERETVLHRPVEWSINQSYGRILKEWRDDEMRVVFQLSDGPGWLGEAILHGARFANRRFDSLLDGFDLVQSLEDPSTGLTAEARGSLSELFGLAITGWARVLERAAADAEATRQNALPGTALLPTTLWTMIKSPFRRWVCSMARHSEQRAVEDLVDEFRRLGALQEHLPAEVDIVHRVIRVHQEEERWKLEHSQYQASLEPSENADNQPATIPFVLPGQDDRHLQGLQADDALASSRLVGRSTAARFEAIGIGCVGEFLAVAAETLASRLDAHWVTAETIRRWQSQVELMCQMAGLKADEVRLLVGAGYTTAAQVAASEADRIHRDVSAFASSQEGARALHNIAAPSIAKIDKWIEIATRYVDDRDQPLRRSA